METMNYEYPRDEGVPDAQPSPEVTGASYPPPAPRYIFPAGRSELVFGLFSLICSLLLCNVTIFGGFQLGFGVAVCGCIICAASYLLATGGRLTGYSATLLLLSMVIAAGFGRSDDGFVKFVMVLFLLVSVNLGLCLIAGQNRRRPGGVGSLLDAPRSLFILGFGQLPRAVGGLFGGLRLKGSVARAIGSIALGLLIMIPLLGIVMPLLMDADAAFENLMKHMPEIDMGETVTTVLLGVGLFFLLYTQAVALRHRPQEQPVSLGSGRGISSLTVNTVLTGLCFVYLLYLISQLAYFVSGFAGIVPQGYTMAEYARRGFFEMAWLCAINLGLIALAVGVVRKQEHRAPLSTRLLCLFIGLTTLFIVAAASAKMTTYISGYGLTRLRVMTQLIILFFGLAALTASVGLFVRKPRYMPVLLIGAMLIGGSAFWVDVDTLVASYNVTAYQHGRLETVDVYYLGKLSDGAIPHIARLTGDADREVAEQARKILDRKHVFWEDYRSWNYATWHAEAYLSDSDADETH